MASRSTSRPEKSILDEMASINERVAELVIGKRRRELYSVKYLLTADNDEEVAKRLGHEKIVAKFREESHPWNQVESVHFNKRAMVLHTRTQEAEEAIRSDEARIGRVLDLGGRGKILSDRFQVTVVGFDMDKNTCPDPDKCTAEWFEDLGVQIKRAYWTCSQLILSLPSKEDAEKLCRDKLSFRARPVYFRPFDKRSVPMFCYLCSKPGHTRGDELECDGKAKCGYCSSNHETKHCDVKGSVKCPNCEGSHNAFSLACKSQTVKKMRDVCGKWRRDGPPWADLSLMEPQPSVYELQKIRYCNYGKYGQKSSPESVGKGKKAVQTGPSNKSFESNSKNRKRKLDTAPASNGGTKRQQGKGRSGHAQAGNPSCPATPTLSTASQSSAAAADETGSPAPVDSSQNPEASHRPNAFDSVAWNRDAEKAKRGRPHGSIRTTTPKPSAFPLKTILNYLPGTGSQAEGRGSIDLIEATDL